MLGHAADVLGQRLAAARTAGWTAEGLAEAHAAARVVAAVATGAGVRELSLGAGAAAPEGRLALPRRLGRPAAALTTHVTTDHVTRALSALPPGAPAVGRARLERLREALATLTRAQYGAGDALDAAVVDEALTAARAIGVALAHEKLTSPREWFRRPPSQTVPEF